MMAHVLPFPQRNKGRVRKTESFQTMGIYALEQIEPSDRPGNVVRLASERAKIADHGDGHLGMMLAGMVFATLPQQQKTDVLDALRCIEMRRLGDTRATVLLDWLDAGRR